MHFQQSRGCWEALHPSALLLWRWLHADPKISCRSTVVLHSADAHQQLLKLGWYAQRRR